jgi:hypothetical protein
VLAAVLVALGVTVLALVSGPPGGTPGDPVGPRGFPALLALVLAHVRRGARPLIIERFDVEKKLRSLPRQRALMGAPPGIRP